MYSNTNFKHKLAKSKIMNGLEIRKQLEQELGSLVQLNFFNNKTIIKITRDSDNATFFYEIKNDKLHLLKNKPRLF